MNLLIQLSKYFFIFLMLLFTLRDFLYLARKNEYRKRQMIRGQILIMYVFTIFAYAIIFLNTFEMQVLILLAGILVFYSLTLIGYRIFYSKSSMLLVNNMLMLLGIGFIMIERLYPDQALKQFIIAAGSTAIAFIIPVMIRKLKVLERMTWVYAVIGILALLGVLALATVSGGAKLSVSVGGITIQFSEVVKITLVFFMAAKLSRDTSFRSVVITTVVAAAHVIILVLSTDLGTALVFFIAYIVVVFVATQKPAYPLAGLAGGVLAALLAYRLFSHVQARVTAWRDPFAVYETSGYQIVQGLFAIGAGGWLGVGLYNGSPSMIPEVSKDFIFAAICEEFGSVFAICLVLVCMNLFLLIVSISMRLHDRFYKLVAIGLGAEYAFQVFLTIGGVTKFIPMTGITLPLVAYGGSSVVSTIIMLAIVQGMYILREDEGEQIAFYKRSGRGNAGTDR